MIPKIIHYIWLGDKPMSSAALMIINNWHRKLPNYQIKKWSEENLPIDKIKEENLFFKRCYEYKLWAFVADYLRLWILYNEGGIYLDTDVEVIRSFDDLLQNSGFMGYEAGNEEFGEYIGTGIIGSEKGNTTIKELLKIYDKEIWEDKEYINTIIFKKKLLKSPEVFKNMKIYPREYFAIFSPYDNQVSLDKKIETSDTYTIHWYNSSWGLSEKGYVFISTKYIKNPVIKIFVKLKRKVGYFLKKR